MLVRALWIAMEVLVAATLLGVLVFASLLMERTPALFIFMVVFFALAGLLLIHRIRSELMKSVRERESR